MAYQDPGDPRRSDHYIERAGDVGWAPVVLGLVLVMLVGVLLLGAPRSADQPSATAQRGDLPNTTPGAPTIPTPAPPQPQ
jgi:hypothetical protein